MLNILWCLYTLLVTRQLNTIFKQIPSNYYIRLEICSSIFFSHLTAKIERHIDCAFSFHLPFEFEIKTMKMEKDKRLCFGVRTHFLVIMLTEAWSHQKLTKIHEEKPKYTKWFAIVARNSVKCARFRICTITPYTWLSCECSTHLHP